MLFRSLLILTASLLVTSLPALAETVEITGQIAALNLDGLGEGGDAHLTIELDDGTLQEILVNGCEDPCSDAALETLISIQENSGGIKLRIKGDVTGDTSLHVFDASTHEITIVTR